MLPPSFDTNVALDAHVSWVVPPLVQHNMLLPLPVQGDVRALDAALADAATLLATLQLDVRLGRAPAPPPGGGVDTGRGRCRVVARGG
jgi:hypothetical protein